jgi:hypothetical protein
MSTYGAKPLIKVGNETVISRQLGLIDSVFAKYEVILVSGFQSQRVMNATPSNIIKVENPHYNNTNVLHSIGIGLRAATTDRILIIYGDLVFNRQLIYCPFDEDSMVVLCDSMKDSEVGCVIHKKWLEQMFYGLPNKWGQVVYATGRELKILKSIAWNNNNAKCYGFEAINACVARGAKFQAISPKGAKAIDIDTSKDIQVATTIL